MCTSILYKGSIKGSAKGRLGWFLVDQTYVGYDHPAHASMEHAINVDFVCEEDGVNGRVAVELDRESTLILIELLRNALRDADDYEAVAASV